MIKSMDNNLTKDHSLFKWHAIACPRRTAGGYDTQPGPKLEGWVKDAGFVKVGVHKLPIPLGTWPKDKRYVSGNRTMQNASWSGPLGEWDSLESSVVHY